MNRGRKNRIRLAFLSGLDANRGSECPWRKRKYVRAWILGAAEQRRQAGYEPVDRASLVWRPRKIAEERVRMGWVPPRVRRKEIIRIRIDTRQAQKDLERFREQMRGLQDARERAEIIPHPEWQCDDPKCPCQPRPGDDPESFGPLP